VAWSVQEVAAIPTDPWDMPLHAVVTERERIEGEGLT
jgi:5-formyltetrahydrofolate cyclo-ligase